MVLSHHKYLRIYGTIYNVICRYTITYNPICDHIYPYMPIYVATYSHIWSYRNTDSCVLGRMWS